MNTLVFQSQAGSFSVLLQADRAPITCKYFSELARCGALDNSSVFRIVADSNHSSNELSPIHIVQIGPARNLLGDRHPIAHENTNITGICHAKWTVSAARFDLGELYGSFFICMRDEPELDYGGQRQPDGQGFAAFGRVIDGFDAVESMYRRAEADEMLKTKIPIYNVTLTDTALAVQAGDHVE